MMSDKPNPYEAPRSGQVAAESLSADDKTTRQVVVELRRAAPWMLTVAVLAFILSMSAFASVIGLLIASRGALLAPLVIMGVIFGILALVFLVTSVMVVNIRSNFRQFVARPSSMSMQRALSTQVNLLKILTIVSAVLLVLVVIGVMRS